MPFSADMSLAVPPGAIALTVILRWTRSSARQRTIVSTAAFDPAYTACPGTPIVAAIDEVSTIRPPSPMCACAACAARNWPRVLTAKVASNSAAVTVPSAPKCSMPALLTSTSMPPRISAARSMRATTASGSAMSACTAWASPPFPAISATTSSAASALRP